MKFFRQRDLLPQPRDAPLLVAIGRSGLLLANSTLIGGADWPMHGSNGRIPGGNGAGKKQGQKRAASSYMYEVLVLYTFRDLIGSWLFWGGQERRRGRFGTIEKERGGRRYPGGPRCEKGTLYLLFWGRKKKKLEKNRKPKVLGSATTKVLGGEREREREKKDREGGEEKLLLLRLLLSAPGFNWPFSAFGTAIPLSSSSYKQPLLLRFCLLLLFHFSRGRERK
ncbi:hypothetical protein V8C37DRAFT_217957 [Trichoderma ceciliae]